MTLFFKLLAYGERERKPLKALPKYHVVKIYMYKNGTSIFRAVIWHIVIKAIIAYSGCFVSFFIIIKSNRCMLFTWYIHNITVVLDSMVIFQRLRCFYVFVCVCFWLYELARDRMNKSTIFRNVVTHFEEKRIHFPIYYISWNHLIFNRTLCRLIHIQTGLSRIVCFFILYYYFFRISMWVWVCLFFLHLISMKCWFLRFLFRIWIVTIASRCTIFLELKYLLNMKKKVYFAPLW